MGYIEEKGLGRAGSTETKKGLGRIREHGRIYRTSYMSDVYCTTRTILYIQLLRESKSQNLKALKLQFP